MAKNWGGSCGQELRSRGQKCGDHVEERPLRAAQALDKRKGLRDCVRTRSFSRLRLHWSALIGLVRQKSSHTSLSASSLVQLQASSHAVSKARISWLVVARLKPCPCQAFRPVAFSGFVRA